VEAVKVNGYKIKPKADLSWADLSGTDLAGAKLGRANLKGANLEGANLSSAKLKKANLEGANLASANLRFADLEEADLIEANLTDAVLCGANLSFAWLHRANLTRANLEEALLRTTRLTEANLTGAVLTGSVFEPTFDNFVIADETTVWPAGFDPEVAWASGAVVQTGDVMGEADEGERVADLVGEHGDLVEATAAMAKSLREEYGDLRDLGDAVHDTDGRLNLADANLANKNLADANLADANLTNANLTNANLADANLTNAILYGTNFTNANLTNANLERALLAGANLSGAILANANLTGANLSGAILANANLARANLTGATAHGVHLSGTNLSGAVLERTALSGMNDDGDTVWPEGFDSEAFRRLTRHELHYQFCHKELPALVFGSPASSTFLLSTLRARSGSKELSEMWNLCAGEFRDLWTTPRDFDLVTRQIADTGWNATVITPPPALEAVEAHYVGVLTTTPLEHPRKPSDLDRVGYFRYVCLERDACDPDLAHIGEWFTAGERKNLGHVTVPSVDTMFEVLMALTTDA